MTSRKRPRDLGRGEGSENNSARDFPAGTSGDEITVQQPASKRPRRAGFGLGSSVGALVDKVVRATASLLGRGRSEGENESGEENVDRRDDGIEASQYADSPVPMDSSSTSGTSESSIAAQGSPEVLNPNHSENQELNQEEPRAPAEHPSLEAEDDAGVVGEATEEMSDASEQVLNPSQNENLEDAPPSSSLKGPVVDEAGEAVQEMSDATEEVPDSQDSVEGLSSEDSGGKRPQEVNMDDAATEPKKDNPTANSPLGGCGCLSGYGGRPETMIGCNGMYGASSASRGAAAAAGVPPSTPPTTVIDWERVKGAQAGLPRLTDADALRHALGFLRATELAHFCLSSTSAREVVSNHAALEMVNRFPTLRIGVREPPHPLSTLRRLAFGSPTGNPAAAAGATFAPPGSNGPMGVVGHPYQSSFFPQQQPNHQMTQLQLQHLQQHQHQHSDLWDKEVVVGNVGSPTGSPVAPRGYRSSLRSAGNVHRGFLADGAYGGGGSSMGWRRRSRGSGLVRCDGQNAERALPSLHYLELCGDLLLSQQKTLPRLDLFRSLQSRTVLGPSQFLTAHMRAVLVDWMVEVAFQFKLSSIALHAAVSALDVCLSKVAVPRCRLQLLGVVCTMIQSQAGGGTQVMTTSDAIHICDSQYNPSQVHSTYNIVVSNTQEATSRTVPATAAEILNRLLRCMGEVSGLTRPLCSFWEKQIVPVKEEYLLANLMIDLALLDQYMFRFRPGTLATAALFFARVTTFYYSKEGIMVTPFAIVEKKNREVLRLYSDGDCSPFIPLDIDLEEHPFGAPGLWEFLSGQPREATAVRKCAERLWLVHQDFLKHISGKASPNPVLFRYQHMFKGIKDKFFPTGSIRLQAYQRLGLVPKPLLEGMLDKHLPSTVSSHGSVVFRGNTGGASVSSAAATAAATGTGLAVPAGAGASTGSGGGSSGY